MKHDDGRATTVASNLARLRAAFCRLGAAMAESAHLQSLADRATDAAWRADAKADELEIREETP